MRIYLAGGVSANLKPFWMDFLDSADESFFGGANSLERIGAVRQPAIQRERERVGAQTAPLNEGAYILESFFYADKWTEAAIPFLKGFLLDSGAFTFFSSNQNQNWWEYIERYADFINSNNVEDFFELDIDTLVGYDEVRRLRAKLIKLTGKQPIPVWHRSRGKNEFLKMCDEFDYVAVGGIVSKEIMPKEYPIFSYLINEAHKRGARIHGLGFTNLNGLRKYHFDSVDSTAWVSGNRFGSVYRFDGENLLKYNKELGQRLSDGIAVALNNMREWLKFQRYAETHL